MTAPRIFLDTVGLLALWDRSDLLECANAAARRPYRKVAAALWHEMKAAGRVFQPAEQDWEEAWADYGQGVAGGPGVVDLISFRAMRHLGIERAFTNDRHFRDAGFQILF